MIHPVAETAEQALARIREAESDILAYLPGPGLTPRPGDSSDHPPMPVGFARTAAQARALLDADHRSLILDSGTADMSYETFEERDAAHSSLVNSMLAHRVACLSGRHGVSVKFWRRLPLPTSARPGRFPIAYSPGPALLEPLGYADDARSAAVTCDCPVEEVTLLLGEPTRDRASLERSWHGPIDRGCAAIVRADAAAIGENGGEPFSLEPVEPDPMWRVRFTFFQPQDSISEGLQEQLRLRRLSGLKADPQQQRAFDFMLMNACIPDSSGQERRSSENQLVMIVEEEGSGQSFGLGHI